MDSTLSYAIQFLQLWFLMVLAFVTVALLVVAGSLLFLAFESDDKDDRKQAIRRAYQGLRSWLSRHLLRAVAAVLLVLALLELLRTFFLDTPSLASLYAAGLLLIAAALCQFGTQELIERITKVGPVELARRRGDIARLASFLHKVEPRRMREQGRLDSVEQFTDEDNFRYTRASQLVLFLRFYGLERTDLANDPEFRVLLFAVAESAVERGELPFAVDCLRWALELFDEPKEQARAHGRMAVALYAWSENLKNLVQRDDYEKLDHGELNVRVKKLLREAISEAQGVLEVDPSNYEIHLLVAYMHNNLDDHDLAVRSNHAALRARPNSAKAKYNMAVSYLKLKDPSSAKRWLEQLELCDEEIRYVLEAAQSDPELESGDKAWDEQVGRLVEKKLVELGRTRASPA